MHVVMAVGGGDYAVDLAVRACERPSLWRHETSEGDYGGTVEYRFVAEAAGTRVTMRFDVTPRSLYGWLGLPILFLRRGRNYRDQLPNLKRELDATIPREA